MFSASRHADEFARFPRLNQAREGNAPPLPRIDPSVPPRPRQEDTAPFGIWLLFVLAKTNTSQPQLPSSTADGLCSHPCPHRASVSHTNRRHANIISPLAVSSAMHIIKCSLVLATALQINRVLQGFQHRGDAQPNPLPKNSALPSSSAPRSKSPQQALNLGKKTGRNSTTRHTAAP